MIKNILRIHSPKATNSHLVKVFGGILLSLLLVVWLHKYTGFPEVYAPIGASAFLVFAAPSAIFAQPANVILGNILGGLIGLIFLLLKLDSFVDIAFAVALSAVVLLYFRVPHPPAIGFPVMFLMYHPSGFITFISIIFVSLMLVLIGIVYHKLTHTDYPIMLTKTRV